MKTRLALSLLLALVLAGVPATGAAQQGGSPIEVPLRVLGGRLLVPVDAGVGHPVDFVIATGSGTTVLTETAAQHLGDAAKLTLGGLPVPMEGFVTIPDDRLAVEGALIGGMIGANMLSQYDVLVDLPGERLVLKQPGREVSWDGVELAAPQRVRVLHGIALSFDVTLNGHEYPATMDLGTPMVIANSAVQADTGIADEDKATIILGGANLSDVAVEVIDVESLKRWYAEGAGFVLLGAPITYDCALSISWAHAELRSCAR